MKQTYIDFLGILFVLIFCSFTLISLILYCSYYNYNPFVNQYDVMSKLGTGRGAVYFNTGLIISGYVGTFMCYERYKNINKVLTIIGVISMCSLLLVGCFPMPIPIHGFFAALMFSTMWLFFLVYSIVERSLSLIFMLVLFSIFSFISMALTEWIIFFAVNGWIVLTSMKFYYKKTKMYYKVQNIYK